MPPHWRPAPRTGKQPPLELPRGCKDFVDLGDGQGWPKMLAYLNDAGLWFPCYQSWGFDSANEPNLGQPAFD